MHDVARAVPLSRGHGAYLPLPCRGRQSADHQPDRSERDTVPDPADPRDEENLSGGWYELAVELEVGEAAQADLALRELQRLAGVVPVASGNILRLPTGPHVVCDFATVRDEESQWVVLGLPLGSLARVEPRIGGYPFSDDAGHAWRQPLDQWLVDLALRLLEVLPFRLALVGFEVSGEITAADLESDLQAVPRHAGVVIVTDRVDYHPATA